MSQQLFWGWRQDWVPGMEALRNQPKFRSANSVDASARSCSVLRVTAPVHYIKLPPETDLLTGGLYQWLSLNIQEWGLAGAGIFGIA